MSDKIVPKKLPLIYWPDKRLNRKCTDVTAFDEDLHQLIADMFATMKYHIGVGLAAPQVGVFKNLFVLWIDREAPLVFINPTISFPPNNPMFEFEEGCLSVPGIFEMRERPQTILVHYQTPDGEEKSAMLTDLTAFAFQHEYDHLQGETFVDGLSTFKKLFTKKKVAKNIKRQQYDTSALNNIKLDGTADTTSDDSTSI